MGKLDGYEDTVVTQRKGETGCIPSGIEWMARHMGVADELSDTFQEDFDQEAQGGQKNGFFNVPPAVSANYPKVRTTPKGGFADANEKITFVSRLIEQGRPCLISLWLGGGRYHIVPVVEADETSLTVLWMDKATIEEQRRTLDHAEIRRLHDGSSGGKDILMWGDDPPNT